VYPDQEHAKCHPEVKYVVYIFRWVTAGQMIIRKRNLQSAEIHSIAVIIIRLYCEGVGSEATTTKGQVRSLPYHIYGTAKSGIGAKRPAKKER
jgi:hypothetical protein